VVDGLPQPFHQDVGDSPQFEADPLQTLEEILAEIDSLPLPTRIRRESTISIERRWVDTEIPNMELLDVLAHAYGVLSQLIHSAHERAGVSHGLVIDVEGEQLSIPHMEAEGNRLPCMVTSRAIRTVNLHLEERTLATGGKMWSVETDREQAEKSARKYGLDKLVRLETAPESPIDLLPMYIKGATAVAHSGEEHGWFIFFFRGIAPVDSRALLARDAADKRDLAQSIAEIVAANRIDGVIEIGEVWQSPATPDPDGAFIRPGAHPERTEAIMIWAETANGQKSAVQIPIKRRRLRRPVVGDVIELNAKSAKNNFLDPVRGVWATWPATQTEPSQPQPGARDDTA
jgi:hypothetical protein